MSFFYCFSIDIARSASGGSELRNLPLLNTTIWNYSYLQNQRQISLSGKPRFLHFTHSLSDNRRTLSQELCSGADSLFSSPPSTLKIKPDLAFNNAHTPGKKAEPIVLANKLIFKKYI
ncbi:MAG: hypothetical protein LHW56_10535 [Candidatus Cloacimonetes bacterium]|nr:hypothetical protein [Candidatus Cloacimonadota bacterium]MDY0173328.1 hypothetical protein [Candidatus Cloacimonadaceae bacterium]